MKRYLVAGLLIVLVPFAAAAKCGKPLVCNDSPTGDCNPRPSASVPAPSETEKCVLTVNGCVSPPATRP